MLHVALDKPALPSQLVTLGSMDLVASLFVSAMKIIQCHVTLLTDTATVTRGGLGRSAHCVSTLDHK